MEGLFTPLQFPFPNPILRDRLLRSIVKVRPLRTLEYAFFESEEDANAFSKTVLDDMGRETIRYGLLPEDRTKCANPEFSEALYTHEFCELIKSGISFPAKTSLKGNGTGVLVSDHGHIATNFHLISGAAEYLELLDGHTAGTKFPISNLEVEVLDRIEGGNLIYRKVGKVALAGTYSKSDAYGKRLDLAILKIEESTPSYLELVRYEPQRFDRIFSIGFSMRTARPEAKRLQLEYQDANYDLRVSSGLIVKLDGENSFLADTDGAPGNSGSAAVNEQGELIGIYSGSTGNGIVDPSKSFRRYVKGTKLLPLLKNSL